MLFFGVFFARIRTEITFKRFAYPEKKLRAATFPFDRRWFQCCLQFTMPKLKHTIDLSKASTRRSTEYHVDDDSKIYNHSECDAAARASKTSTEKETKRQPQRRTAARIRCVDCHCGGGCFHWSNAKYINPSREIIRRIRPQQCDFLSL